MLVGHRHGVAGHQTLGVVDDPADLSVDVVGGDLEPRTERDVAVRPVRDERLDARAAGRVPAGRVPDRVAQGSVVLPDVGRAVRHPGDADQPTGLADLERLDVGAGRPVGDELGDERSRTGSAGAPHVEGAVVLDGARHGAADLDRRVRSARGLAAVDHQVLLVAAPAAHATVGDADRTARSEADSEFGEAGAGRRAAEAVRHHAPDLDGSDVVQHREAAVDPAGRQRRVGRLAGGVARQDAGVAEAGQLTRASDAGTDDATAPLARARRSEALADHGVGEHGVVGQVLGGVGRLLPAVRHVVIVGAVVVQPRDAQLVVAREGLQRADVRLDRHALRRQIDDRDAAGTALLGQRRYGEAHDGDAGDEERKQVTHLRILLMSAIGRAQYYHKIVILSNFYHHL